MAVTMLIGNRPDISFSPFAKGNSIPSVIANEFTEATYDLYLSALVELGLVLLLVSVGFSALGRILIWQMNRPRMGRFNFSGLLQSRKLSSTRRSEENAAAENDAHSLTHSTAGSIPPRSRQAEWTDRIMTGGSATTINTGFAALAVIALLFAAVALLPIKSHTQLTILVALAFLALVTALSTVGVLGLCQMVTTVPLFLIVGYLLFRGATALSWDFFVNLPAPVGESGGGMANAFYGSALMIGLATAFSVPIGLLAAVYLAEYRSPRLGSAVRFVAEMLGSVPSIVIGIFGYYAVVRPITSNFSGLAGGFALGVMMLPIVIRASEEALKLVPTTLRHASYALGANQMHTVIRVCIPAALPAIITAIFLEHRPSRRRNSPPPSDRVQQRLLAALAQRLHAVLAGVHFQLRRKCV